MSEIETIERPTFLKRNFLISDLGFIARSFANGMKKTNSYTHMLDNLFYEYFRPLINNMVSDDTVKISIYYFDFEGDETLAGYTIVHNDHLIYCYIKRPYRGLGLFQIMKDDYKDCAFRTIANGLTKKLFTDLIYDPFYAVIRWGRR